MSKPIFCKHEIPFHAKELDFTCGIAAIRMAIQALTQINIPEEKLIEIIGTSPAIGTPLSFFEENAKKISETISNETGKKIKFLIGQRGSFDLLKKLLNEGYVVLLNHKKPAGNPHWAVLYSIDSKQITLIDPEFGPNTTYALVMFNWQGGIKTPTNKAYVAIRLYD